MVASIERGAKAQTDRIEWGTLGLILLCFWAWIGAVSWLPTLSLWLALPVLVLVLILHASLTHEVCHGHPLPWRRVSEALVMVNPGLAVPYLRFRDTHLAHHQDAVLTDPYDDPESNYLDPDVWARMPKWRRYLYSVNNTLAGRMALGPLIGQFNFMAQDWALVRAGDMSVLKGWLWHLPGMALVIWAVAHLGLSLWLYLICAYAAVSILKIRTFLEHQAHRNARERTVIIEDRGLLAFLFLNNNLHAVHHMHPQVPWYRLPSLYAARRDTYQARNGRYVFRSYRQIFGQYLWRAKDPVPHPLWPLSKN